MTWTLSDIRAKVRAISGRPSTDQISNADLNEYINNYYLFTMPFELKEQITNQFLTFKTKPGVDVYSFPGGYFTDSPGAYADGFPLVFYQDVDVFYQDWPQQYAVDILAAGDGVTNAFTGTLQNPPAIIGSAFIASDDPSGTSQVISDNGLGVLTGNGSGTLVYLTGAFTASFTAIPAVSATIYAKYMGYSRGRPQGILFHNNEFTLRPVPDQAYQLQMQGYIKPTALTNDSDTPLQEEWGPLLAYGAAVEIFNDTGDTENFDRYYPMLKRQENVSLGRTIEELNSQQSVPRF